MRTIGLDIGTTSISAVVAEDGRVIHSVTEPNGAARISANPENRIQEAGMILDKVLRIKNSLAARFAPIAAIGVTGQMHGILYINEKGEAVSPLYTWQDQSGELLYRDMRYQDQSGELLYRDMTYSEYLSELTGYRVASGYGLVTDFVNRKLGRVPQNAVMLCNIQDYITMKLTGRKTPVTHISNAAGLGFYSLDAYDFDPEALRKIGVNRGVLPRVTAAAEVVGEDCHGIPVTVALGDNQASFLGSGADERSVLVNIGTGSQVSVLTAETAGFEAGEIRPFARGKNLLVGAPLCGGRSFALLQRFFAETLRCFGAENTDIYAVMNVMAAEEPGHCSLSVDTRFCGTRKDPAQTGSVIGITEENFTPQELTRGFLLGMCNELYSFYGQMKDLTGECHVKLVGAGNGIRKNRVLQGYLETIFKMPLTMPENTEEAAFGASIFAQQ